MNVVQSQPSHAERARTVIAHASTVVVEIGSNASEVVDSVGVDADGSLVLLAGVGGPLAERVAEHAAPCVIQAALVSPLAGPDRLLDRVTVSGLVWLEADVDRGLDLLLDARPAESVLRRDRATLLRVMVTRLQLDGEPVDLAAYARAKPDPLATGSDEFVEHLMRGHVAELLELAHLFPPEVVNGMLGLAPVRVDRFGLTFRVRSETGWRRTRLDFPTPIRNHGELPRAMQALQRQAAEVTTCPFNGQPRSTAPPA